jgi:hypothetical protein
MKTTKTIFPRILLLIFLTGLMSLPTFAQKIELKKGKKYSALWKGNECSISLKNKQKYKGIITDVDNLSITIKSNNNAVERIPLDEISLVRRKVHIWSYGIWTSLITYKKGYNFTKWNYKYQPKK